MKKGSASYYKGRMMQKLTNNSLRPFILTTSLVTMGFVANAAQPLRTNQKAALLSIAYFTESANNSINSLNSLLRKDNYRNKITTLNNPTNSELGFSLKNEILAALQPLLNKAKKTDKRKFGEVIENFLKSPEEDGISSVKKYMPALGIFSTVLSLVGNLVIAEKNITREDLNKFITEIQQYFYQYERLNAINEQFSNDLQKLLEKSGEIKEDLKDFLVDCITSMNRDLSRTTLKTLPVEVLLQRYYDPQKLQDFFDTCSVHQEQLLFPGDAPTSVKLITSGIKRLQKEFESIYSENYLQLKELLNSLKTTIPDVDQEQVEKTSKEIDRLYNESRLADVTNLNIAQVDERMNTVCRIINAKYTF